MTAPKREPTSIFEALQNQIERVTRKRERWLGYGVPAISTTLMKAEIDAAKSALASMEPERIIRAIKSMEGYSDDD